MDEAVRAGGGDGGARGEEGVRRSYTLGCTLGACMSVDGSRDELIDLQAQGRTPVLGLGRRLGLGERGEEGSRCEQGLGRGLEWQT